MCGLSGEIRFDGRAADVAACACATEAMERRGPDGSGVWARGPVALCSATRSCRPLTVSATRTLG